MKHLFILLVSIIGIQSMAHADYERPISFHQLPVRAQQFINQHFSDSTIMYAKVETEIWGKKYDVYFINGDKVEFDKDGNWTDIECIREGVPLVLIPKPILVHVNRLFQRAFISKIEKDRGNYDVQLSNGMEIEFDRNFNIIDMDD